MNDGMGGEMTIVKARELPSGSLDEGGARGTASYDVGSPAIHCDWTRGFASPPRDGFAVIGHTAIDL